LESRLRQEDRLGALHVRCGDCRVPVQILLDDGKSLAIGAPARLFENALCGIISAQDLF
jgi:hypothetical protein